MERCTGRCATFIAGSQEEEDSFSKLGRSIFVWPKATGNPAHAALGQQRAETSGAHCRQVVRAGLVTDRTCVHALPVTQEDLPSSISTML